MATITVYPSGYVSDDYSYNSASNIENGYNSADNSTLAKIYATKGALAETYFYYTFDLSAIPSDAVITSVTCSAKLQGDNRLENQTVQLYSGENAKGSPASMPLYWERVVSITAGDWNREELNNCRLKLYAKRSRDSTTASSKYVIKFYGATLTIEYAEPDIIPIIGNINIGGVSKEIVNGYCNIGGIWKTIAKSYTNINGVWKPTHGIGDVVFK